MGFSLCCAVQRSKMQSKMQSKMRGVFFFLFYKCVVLVLFFFFFGVTSLFIVFDASFFIYKKRSIKNNKKTSNTKTTTTGTSLRTNTKKRGFIPLGQKEGLALKCELPSNEVNPRQARAETRSKPQLGQTVKEGKTLFLISH